MALAETIVSINKNSFTPFSPGLALQMHHVYGSKNLVETLHSHGFCASYNELRRYLTSLADHEINKIENGTYIPHGICSLPGELTLIQEGADNIDINTETIDGKDTFHSMARAAFRVKSAPPSSEALNDARSKRNQERSLPLTEKTVALISCLPYDKPKERMVPIRREDAHDEITRCEVKNAETQDVSWMLLRLFSRNAVEFPIACHVPRSEQIIPFWTGYYKKTSEHCESFSLVSYRRFQAHRYGNSLYHHEKVC
jgi:hypothetical protein